MDRRHLIAGLVALVGAAAFAPPAAADHHLMSIREVFPGTAAKPGAEYIELQMYAAGQNNTTGHTITVCDAVGGCVVRTLTGTKPPNGDNQRTVLIGGDDFPSGFPGVAPDYPVALLLPDELNPAGGAVCFNAVPTPDCVAWGSFPGGVTAVSGTGTAAGAIPDGSSLERKISANCATLLEAADDTNDSAADFAFNGSPVPRPNSVAPTETQCAATADPETQIDKGPKKKIRKNKATFKFSSTGIGVVFECALDKKAFKPCTSPHTVKKLKKGKHTFKVAAIDANNNRDETAATQRFKVLKK